MARSVRAASAVAVVALLSTASTFALSQSQTDYTYDVQGQLKKAERSDTASTYTYDNAGNRTHLTVTTVNGNHPPTASNVTVPATAGGPTVNVPLLTSGTDQDGDPLTLTITSLPAQGTAVLASGGLGINYTASSAVPTGAYTIGYSVSDTHATATANITVNVTNSTPPPPSGAEILPSSFSASSSYGGYGYTGLTTANGMRDGQFFANNTIHGTNSEADAWIKADLGSIQTVGSVKLAPPDSAAAGSWGYTYLNGAEVQYSINNSSWTTVATVSGAADGAYSTVNMGGVSARYVRVHKTSDYVGLGDFMVFSASGGGSGGGNPANHSPVAGPYYLTTHRNSPNTVDPRVNVEDADGDALTVTGVSTPGHGSASFTATTITYSPESTYSGSDTFTYTVSDGHGGTATATVYCTIIANRNPIANNDSIALAFGEASLRFYPLTNDTDPDGDPLVMVGMTPPPNGLAYRSSTYIDYIPNGFYGTESFTYTIGDGRGSNSSSTATITVTVEGPPNQNPDAPNRSLTTTRSTSAVVTPNAYDPDGDPVTITAVSTPGHGTAVKTSANGITYTPTGYYAGPDSFTYTVSDNRGGTATGTVSVTVNPGPPLPPVAVDDYISMPHDTTISFDPTTNDSDPDSGFIVVGTISASHGQATRNSRTITYTPDPGYVGPDTIVYHLSDFTALEATATIHITVTP